MEDEDQYSMAIRTDFDYQVSLSIESTQVFLYYCMSLKWIETWEGDSM